MMLFLTRGLFLALFFVSVVSLPAEAEDRGEARAQVLSAGVILRAKVYYLDARIDIHLGAHMAEAIRGGIPLVFALRIEVYHPRSYIWDDRVALLEQRYRLEYQVLTDGYVLKNLNSNIQSLFPALDVAENILGTIVDLPILDRNLLDPEKTYRGRIKIVLDSDELPLPLRLQSYISSDWSLASEWYSWPVHF